ncbi:hypothetical protein SDC9_120856 [bioreactor metagenome]|uniref:YitT family protein n=1 Tax=bioreactor metagenome TaxID=1076179 RepID=A0A645CAB5_9ZZZZ
MAAVSGGICVGGGAGIIVRAGGSAGSDDVLALLIMRSTGWRIYAAYLFTDLTVLLLSLTYIPVQQIGYSFITVTISSLLIDIIKNLDLTGQNKEKPVPKVLD